MERRKRRKFTPEYKAEVVKLVQTSGKSVGQVSSELELTETAVARTPPRLIFEATARGGRR